MNNISLSRTLAGAGIILIGLAALLGSLGFINFGHLFATYWPVVVIAIGLLILLANPREQYMWAGLFIVLGIAWQLRTLEVIDFNIWSLFWPLLLIALGWSVITNRTGGSVSNATSGNDENIVAVLGGVDTKVESHNYTGNKTTAIMGGNIIDLRGATIKKEATIEVFTLMGGIELRVPENWQIRSSIMPILGSVENKTSGTSAKTAPILNIVGTVILGGVEVKS